MSEKNKLFITITDERGQGKGQGSIPTPLGNNGFNNSANEQEKESLIGRYAEHELFHLVKRSSVQAVNYQLSNIGNFTGDYISQRKINEAKQYVSGIATIGLSTLAGAKYGVPGAVAGFIVGSASLITGGIYENITNKAENSKINFNIGQLKDRVGLNTIYDGSRGTEN